MKQASFSIATNSGKLALLHRLAGAEPIVIYNGTAENCQKLFETLQKWCNYSADISRSNNVIMCTNPLLAQSLCNITKTTSVSDTISASQLPSEGCVII